MASFSEEMNRIFLAGVGAVAATAEKANEIVEDFVKKGELTVEQGKVLNEELKRDVQEKVKKILPMDERTETAEEIANRMGSMTPEEIEILKAKLTSLEEAPQTDEEVKL